MSIHLGKNTFFTWGKKENLLGDYKVRQRQWGQTEKEHALKEHTKHQRRTQNINREHKISTENMKHQQRTHHINREHETSSQTSLAIIRCGSENEAIFAAVFMAASTVSDGGNIFVTNPRRSASVASICSPVRIISIALCIIHTYSRRRNGDGASGREKEGASNRERERERERQRDRETSQWEGERETERDNERDYRRKRGN